MKFLTSAGLAAFLFLPGGVNQAALITFEFSGVIDSVYEPNNEFGGVVHKGDPFVVRYTFDPLTPDLIPNYEDQARYTGPAASLVLPGVTYVSTAGLDVTLGGNFTTLFFWTPMSATVPRIFSSFSGMSLSDDHFPVKWTGSTGELLVKAPRSSAELKGTIVPEPTTLALLLVGFLSIRRHGRYSRRAVFFRLTAHR